MQQQIYNVFFFNIGKPCFRGTREKDEYLRNTCDQGKSSEKTVYENTLRSSSDVSGLNIPVECLGTKHCCWQERKILITGR